MLAGIKNTNSTVIMQKTIRQILPEAIWLTVSLIITFILLIILFDSQFIKSNTTLLIYDTYFVVPSWLVVTALFLFITFLIYIAKEIKNRFGRSVPNMILLICAILLVIFLTLLNHSLDNIPHGWTAYPPLSALGPADESDDAIINSTIKFFTIFQVLLIL
ncbi:MAG TPA: hypothetical protein VIS75_16810, partial [Chitinophagaceae bacterium]